MNNYGTEWTALVEQYSDDRYNKTMQYGLDNLELVLSGLTTFIIAAGIVAILGAALWIAVVYNNRFGLERE